MYRYHIMLSFDKNLHAITSSEDERTSTICTEIPVLSSDGRFRYGLERTITDLRRKKVFPSETGFDVILLGLLVYIADMRISRLKQAQDSWSREITITIPVFNKEWIKHKETFECMLKFLTGDLWTVEFTKREMKLAQEDKVSDRTDAYGVASLFSGGMDSLIAAINYMEQGQPTLLVSHAAESRVRHWQTDLLSVLDEMYGNIRHDNAYYWTNLDDVELTDGEKDKNQRSRSFLFIAIALLAMSGTQGCTRLLMPENGLIALNVPLDSTRIGSHSTRTTHPFYLKLWNEVASDIFGFSISNPYWNKTKGEMAAECLNKEVLKIAMAQSYSCSSVNTVSIHSGKSNHCGHCLPCIIRRAAMHKAFGNFDPSVYMDSNVTELVYNREAKGEQIRSFQYAIERLKKNPESSIRVDGEYYDKVYGHCGHSWQETEGWIIDLTGDQFENDSSVSIKADAVYVGGMDGFHRQFKIVRREHSCGIECLGSGCWVRMHSLYDKIISYMK